MHFDKFTHPPGVMTRNLTHCLNERRFNPQENCVALAPLEGSGSSNSSDPQFYIVSGSMPKSYQVLAGQHHCKQQDQKKIQGQVACKYGANCNRKDLKHFEEYGHPLYIVMRNLNSQVEQAPEKVDNMPKIAEKIIGIGTLVTKVIIPIATQIIGAFKK